MPGDMPLGRFELVASGAAVHFDTGKGRPMREWAMVETASDVDWDRLAIEAHAFVAGGSRGR